MGVNVSNPLTADHGKPFFFTFSCMFLAVMSIANAIVTILRCFACRPDLKTYHSLQHENQPVLPEYLFRFSQ